MDLVLHPGIQANGNGSEALKLVVSYTTILGGINGLTDQLFPHIMEWTIQEADQPPIILTHRNTILGEIGKTMLVCGQEEPIQVNEQVYALKEETGEIRLSRIQDTRLNRYSFVWLGEPGEAVDAFSRLLQAILNYMSLKVTWFLVWPKDLEGDNRIRSRWVRSKRRKEGWAIYEDDDLYIASKPVDDGGPQAFSPLHYDWRDGSLLLIFGNAPPAYELANGPSSPSIRLMAQQQPFAPSQQFLDWLAGKQLSVGYEGRDVVGHMAFIIVGTHRLPTTHLRRQGVIQDIKTGTEASLVWTHF